MYWRSWDIGRSRCINFKMLKGFLDRERELGNWCLEFRIMDVMDSRKIVYRNLCGESRQQRKLHRRDFEVPGTHRNNA